MRDRDNHLSLYSQHKDTLKGYYHCGLITEYDFFENESDIIQYAHRQSEDRAFVKRCLLILNPS
jgi:hypothetical protein